MTEWKKGAMTGLARVFEDLAGTVKLFLRCPKKPETGCGVCHPCVTVKAYQEFLNRFKQLLVCEMEIE